jgi:8-oxo-dGTP diphosphatase
MPDCIHVVLGIIVQSNKLLVSERPAHKPYAGYWEFPGGKIEQTESAEQALSREMGEELGIEVVSSQYLFDHYHIYPDREVRMEVWRVSEFLGAPHGKEGQRLCWVSVSALAQMHVLPGNIFILDQLKLIHD